jgi:hypothetical protein
LHGIVLAYSLPLPIANTGEMAELVALGESIRDTDEGERFTIAAVMLDFWGNEITTLAGDASRWL